MIGEYIPIIIMSNNGMVTGLKAVWITGRNDVHWLIGSLDGTMSKDINKLEYHILATGSHQFVQKILADLMKAVVQSHTVFDLTVYE